MKKIALLALLAVGCGGECPATEFDDGLGKVVVLDGGQDGGQQDAGVPDAGQPDAGKPDHCKHHCEHHHRHHHRHHHCDCDCD